jgi:hypothetical protein
MANHQPNVWEFGGEVYEVQPGQFITSLPSIVDKCNCKEITIQKVRTALARFEKLGFLTGKSTNKNRLITITNWEFYQDSTEDDNNQNNRHLTGNQQALNRHLTANEECKNDKNNKNEENSQSINPTPTPTPTPSPTPKKEIDRIDTSFIKKLKSAIGYEDLIISNSQNEVDNIVNLITDLVSTNNDEIHIGGKTYDKDYVKQVFLTLDTTKTEFLIMKCKGLGKDANIRNPKRYMQSCIFSATINYETEWNEFFNRTYYGGDNNAN